MASTIIKVTAKDETKEGLNSATNSFKQFTSSIDSITGGLGSKVTNLLANPWTAVAAGVAATVKITKELWSTGINATAGYEQLKASFGDYADEVDSFIQSIDKTTLASKDDLEGMAKSLSQYGLSMKDLESVLQTTADIATVTGKSFGTIESAVISAMNGQDKALTKLVPEWETMKKTYGSTEEALKHLGEQYAETRLQFTSGSITQTLDNMSSSWQNIKDNLGQTLVMKIQSTGVLDTISTSLSNIEKRVSDRFTRESFEEAYNISKDMDMSKFYSDIVSGVIPESEARAYREVLKSTILPWGWQAEMRETLKDALAEVSKDELSQTDVEFAELISSFRSLRSLTTWEDSRGDLLHSIDTLMDKYTYYGADESRLQNLNKFRSEVESYQKYSSNLFTSVFLDPNSGRLTHTDSEGTVWQLGASGEWEVTLPTVSRGEKVSFLQESFTTSEILTRCAYGKFNEVTEDDWNHVFNTISLSDDLWDMYADTAFEYYDAWNLSKVQAPTTTKPGVTYMFGGTGISATTGYGHSVGDTTVAEAIAANEAAAEEVAKQAEADKAYHDAVLSTISDILSNTESFVGAIKSGDVGKAMISGLQGVGGILGSLSTAGEALKGTGADNWFTSLAPTLGAIAPWLGIAAGGVSLISSLIDTEGEGVMDESTRAKNVTYSGATTVNITNSFDGANIVGSDGMGELAKIIRNEMNRLAYNNQ